MDFGLGLVLSFTDNATAGINNAVNSLNTLTQTAENATSSLDQMASLSALSVVSDQIGSAFLGMGNTIISTLGQVIRKVTDTGTTLMYAGNQLQMLYSDLGEGAGDMMLGKIQEYAKNSIFAFEDLIPVVTSLKSVGIEAFDEIATSTGSASQTLMDYASDLAAFAPQMRNAYGTGIQAAMGALREYIAEGNALSLKRGAGIDITSILGEDKGSTMEARAQQVADLIEKLGMLGMTASLAGTPMQRLSNMGDILFQTIAKISESGVYDKFSDLITKISDYVFAIPDEELTNIANVIGSALTSIMTPLEWVIDKVLALADSLRGLVANNPELVKIATIGVAVVGVLLILAGVALKVTSAMSGLSLMLLTMGKTFGSIGTLIKTGALKILGTLLPLTATIGLLALAWKSDFAGIRTNTTFFVNGLVTSFKTAYQAVNGSVEDLKVVLADLNSKDDFFSNLTVGLMEVMMLFKAVADGWNDYTLSEENFLKAKELGILPLVEAILDLKYRFDFFKQGFIDGWKQIGENVKTAVMGFLDNIEGTALESLVDNLTEFLQKLASGDTQAWYDFGQSFANFTADALVFYGIVKAIGAVAKFLTPIVAIFQGVSKLKLGGVFGKIAEGIGAMITVLKGGQGVGFFSKLLEVFKAVASGGIGLKDSLTIVFGSVGTTVAGIISFVGGIAMAVTGFVKQLIDGFSWFWEIIKWVGLAIGAVGAVILGICSGPIAALVAGIIGVVTTAIVLIKDNWAKICEFFSTIGSWIYDNVIEPVATFFVNLWNGIVTGVSTVINKVKTFFSTIASWIYTNVIQPIVNFFTNIVFPIVSKIVEIVMKVVEIITVLVSVFVQWIKANVIDPIVNFFVELWNTIVAGITSFVESAKAVIGTIVEWINTNIITPVSTFFSGLWEGIVTGVTSFIESVKSVMLTIVEWISTNIITPISEFFSTLWEGITTAFNTVADTITSVLKGAVNAVLEFICGIINGVISALNGAIDVINAIPGVSITKITELEVPQLAQGGVVTTPTLSVVGEAGAEAVMPLENNTGWIGVLAKMISTQMSSIEPVSNSTSQVSNTQGDNNYQKYLTTNTTNNQTIQGDTDNSVVFNEGAIQVTVQNASEEEAMKFARMVLEYIRRQQELDRMLNYA